MSLSAAAAAAAAAVEQCLIPAAVQQCLTPAALQQCLIPGSLCSAVTQDVCRMRDRVKDIKDNLVRLADNKRTLDDAVAHVDAFRNKQQIIHSFFEVWRDITRSIHRCMAAVCPATANKREVSTP